MVLLASACAGHPPTSANGSRAAAGEACSSVEQPGVSAATSQRLAGASNVFEYENIWRDEHPGATLGTVTRSEISALLRSKTAQVQACYEAALGNLHDGRGRVVARFVIDSAGKVPNVSITSNDFQVPEVGCCLAKLIVQSAFPVPTNGEFVVVEYPFSVRVSNAK
jgi:hypothetical protein